MKRTANENSILFIICLASSLVPFMTSSLNLALPEINKDLSVKATMSGWIPASYMLSTAIFQIPFARIADIIGRRKIFLCGVILFLIFSVLSGFAYSEIDLIIYRFCSGIGSAMMFGTSMAILTSSIPKERRGQALGINTAVVYSSLAAGPFLGGLLTEHLGWHSIFFISAGISLLVFIGSLFILKDDWKSEGKQKFDYIGAILYAIGLSSLIYGFSKLPHSIGFILLGLGSVILILFALYEKKQSQPVFDVNMFSSNRIFRLSSLSALINYSATFAVSFMLSLYLQYVQGLSPVKAGLILIIQSVVQSIVSLKSGKLSDKISPALLATTGMSIIAVGLLFLCFVNENSSLYYIASILLFLGIGFGIFSSPNMNIIMSSVDTKYYGMASATSGTMRLTGQAFSMGIAMMAISLFIGNIEISFETHTGLLRSMRMTFIVSLILCLLGIYTSSIRTKKQLSN